MLIEEKPLDHWIDNFYGYGSWHASSWFIGYEEGGGEVPEEVADKLNYFHEMHVHSNGALCDIRELYKYVAVRWDGPKADLFSNLYEYRFDSNAVQHGAWKNLIAFVHERFLSVDNNVTSVEIKNSKGEIRKVNIQ